MNDSEITINNIELTQIELKQKQEEMAKMLRLKKRPLSSDSEEIKRDRHIISDIDLNEAGDEEEEPKRSLVGSVVKGTLAKKEKLGFESTDEIAIKKKSKFRPSFQRKQINADICPARFDMLKRNNRNNFN